MDVYPEPFEELPWYPYALGEPRIVARKVFLEVPNGRSKEFRRLLVFSRKARLDNLGGRSPNLFNAQRIEQGSKLLKLSTRFPERKLVP